MNIVNNILLFVFLASALVQVFYYLYFYLFLKNPEKITSDTELPLSVIICAKNEEKNLEKFLPLILSQDYNKYEVIVVDDASVDNTEELLGNLKLKYKNLRYTKIPLSNKLKKSKKYAQTLGIKSAKNEHLVFLDADCYPVSKNWLTEINNRYNQQKEIILLYGKYKKEKGFLNKIIRFDTFFIAQQYLSFSLRGINYMGVGRNLAYTKSVFFRNKGFASHLNIASGDDDLFVNENSTRENTIIEISSDSFTESIPEKKFKDWINQKSRHLTTAKRYKIFHKILLLSEPLSRVFLLLIFWFIFLKINVLFTVGVFAGVLLIKFFIYKKNLSLLYDKDLLLYSLIIDLILPFINILVLLNLKLNKHLRWK